MIRPSSFRRSCSVIALSAVALAACATHDGRDAPRRHGSIKDDPADVMPHAPRAQRASYVMGTPARDVPARDVVSPVRQVAPPSEKAARAEPKATMDAPAKIAAREPSPVLPKVEPTPPTVRVIVEAPSVEKAPQPKPATETPPPAKSAALDTRPVAPPKPAEAQPVPVEQPKTTVVTPEPPAQGQPSRPAVVIRPAETAPAAAPAPQDSRPTTELRRRPTPEVVSPPRNSAVPPPAVQPPAAAPPAAAPSVAAVAPPPAPPAAVATPAPIVPPVAPSSQTQATPDAKADPKVAVLTDDQRVASVLSRVDGYMKAGSFQNARTLLEDASKAGNPKLLTALAETYDPLVLREQYPKLARTGDPEKAIALYEQATAKGATNLSGRIAALKTLAGAKR